MVFDVVTVGSGLIDIFINTGEKLFQKPKKVNDQEVVHVPFGSKIMVEEVRTFTGGGATNTAISFAKFGLKTGIISLLGSDNKEDKISEELRRNNVTELIKKRASRENGFSIILDAKGHDRTVLAFKGPADDLNYDELPKDISTKWFYFASMMGKSFMMQQKLADYAVKNKIKIMFNPSSYVVKKGKKFVSPLMKKSEIVVLNKEESGYITQGSIEDRLKQLVRMGPKIAIITDGKNGAWLLKDKFIYRAIPHKVNVVESTGAGDAFASAFLASFIKTNGIKKSLHIALANSQSVLSHYGAKNKLLTWDEANNKIKNNPTKVIITKIK